MINKVDSTAYLECVDAGIAGATDSNNPYPIGSDEAMDWEDGRSSAETDEEQ